MEKVSRSRQIERSIRATIDVYLPMLMQVKVLKINEAKIQTLDFHKKNTRVM